MQTIYSPAGQSFFTRSVARIHHINIHFGGTFYTFSTFTFTALNDSNDVYTYKQMIKQPNVSKFVEAMVKKVMDHEEWRYWICVPKSEIPKRTSTILAFIFLSVRDGLVARSSNGRQGFVIMVECSSGESITGIYLLQ